MAVEGTTNVQSHNACLILETINGIEANFSAPLPAGVQADTPQAMLGHVHTPNRL